MSFQMLDFWVSGPAENEKPRDTKRNVVSRLSGHSINSPTSRLAATPAAAYTFSTASLHTPQRPPPRKPRHAPRLEARTANRCDWPSVIQQASRSPLFTHTPDPAPRLDCRVGRACRGRVRRVCRPGVRLGVRWGSLRGRCGIRPGCRTGDVLTLRSPTCLPERLSTRKRGVGRGSDLGALRVGGSRYEGRGGVRRR